MCMIPPFNNTFQNMGEKKMMFEIPFLLLKVFFFFLVDNDENQNWSVGI